MKVGIRHTSTFIAILVLLFFMAGCSRPKLTSKRVHKTITIDGNSVEWENDLEFFEDQTMGVGIANDEKNLYFCAVTSDDELHRQLVLRGLNIWLDSEGGKTKDYGIRYPLGMAAMNQGLRQEMMKGVRGQPDGKMPSTLHLEKIPNHLQMEFALMGAKAVGNDFDYRKDMPIQFRVPVYNNYRGIELKIQGDAGRIIYEGKIPMDEFIKDKEKVSDVIGLGIEIPEMERPSGRPGGRMQGNRPGGGMGHSSGGMAGDRPKRGKMRPSAMKPMKSLSFWGKVTLAQEASHAM